MLAQRNPQAVYRRIEFDARVSTADPVQLVAVCYEQLTSALGTALHAHDRADNALKSDALTRALSALMALQMGVRGNGGVVDALHQMFDAARRTVLDNALRFKPEAIAAVRQDFIEIAQALAAVR